MASKPISPADETCVSQPRIPGPRYAGWECSGGAARPVADPSVDLAAGPAHGPLCFSLGVTFRDDLALVPLAP